jgi:hypothetical protein
MEDLNNYTGLPVNPNKQNGLIGNADLANILMGVLSHITSTDTNTAMSSAFLALPTDRPQQLQLAQQPSGSFTNEIYGALSLSTAQKGRLSYLNIAITALTGASSKVVIQGSYDNATFFDIGGVSHATNAFITPATGLVLNDSVRLANDFHFYKLKVLSVSGNIDLTALATFS